MITPSYFGAAGEAALNAIDWHEVRDWLALTLSVLVALHHWRQNGR